MATGERVHTFHFTPRSAAFPYLFGPRLSHVQEGHTERGGSNPTAARQLDSWGILALEKLLPLAFLVSFCLALLLEKS